MLMVAQEHKRQWEQSEMRVAQTPHEGSQAGSQRYCAVLQQRIGLGVLLPTDLSCDNKRGCHRFRDVAKKTQLQQQNQPKQTNKNPK